MKKTKNDYMISCLYVDDKVIFGRKLGKIMKTKNYLSRNIDIKDIGEAYIVLGMKLTITHKGIY